MPRPTWRVLLFEFLLPAGGYILFAFAAVQLALGFYARYVIMGMTREAIMVEMLEKEPKVADDAMKALQIHLLKADHLVEFLERSSKVRIEELKNVQRTLQESRDQRAMLDLTPDERRALESLLRQPRSIREIFASWEFWIGNVVPSAAFFMLN